MNGSAAQSIGANVFTGNTIKDLIINNSAGVTLQGPLNITGIVTLQNGNLDSGGNLTLISSAAQTAVLLVQEPELLRAMSLCNDIFLQDSDINISVLLSSLQLLMSLLMI